MKIRRMTTLVGIAATGAALVNKVPDLDKKMPKVDKLVSNFKPKKKRTMTNIVTSGLVGFGLAYAIPKGKNMMRDMIQ